MRYNGSGPAGRYARCIAAGLAAGALGAALARALGQVLHSLAGARSLGLRSSAGSRQGPSEQREGRVGETALNMFFTALAAHAVACAGSKSCVAREKRLGAVDRQQ